MIKMVTLRCQDCGRTTEGKKSDVDETSCTECDGSFAVKGSEDDSYETTKCDKCGKEIPGDVDTFSCDECEDDTICQDCIIEFSNTNLCKKCIDKEYPRRLETKVEYKDKIVEKEVKVFVDKEGTPIDISFNPQKKSKFD